MLTPSQIVLIGKHLRSDNWLLNKALIAELANHYAKAISTENNSLRVGKIYFRSSRLSEREIDLSYHRNNTNHKNGPASTDRAVFA